MCSLQGYYGLKLGDEEGVCKGLERSAYGEGEGEVFSKSLNPPLNLHRKCRSVVFTNVEEEDASASASTQESKYSSEWSDSWSEKFARRRQKSESDFMRSPEMLSHECSSGGFAAVGSIGLALRPKAAASRGGVADSEASSINPCANIVRRSSSTSNLQDSDSSTFTSLWPITRPIFDGLPKPITGRRNKAALD